MFYRVENGSLIQAPEKNIKLFIANPTDEQYRFLGYTNEIIEDEMPVVEEGSEILYEAYYEQADGVIHKRYRKVEDVLPPEDSVYGDGRNNEVAKANNDIESKE